MARRPGKARLAAAYRNLWESPEGRIVLADLMSRAGVLNELSAVGPDGNATDIIDPTALAIAEGQRRVGVYIARQIAAKPSDFVDVVRHSQDTLDRFLAA